MALRRAVQIYGNVLQKRAAFSTSSIRMKKDDELRALDVDHSPAKWNFNYYPDKLPAEMTKDEIKKRAEKYNLEPEDYRPVDPDEGLFTGDYPDVPYTGQLSRSEFEEYDIQQSRRNFMEPNELDSTDYRRRYCPEKEYRLGISYQNRMLRIATGLLFFAIVNYVFQTSQIAKPKQYPYNYMDFNKEFPIHNAIVKKNIHGAFTPEPHHH